MFGLRFYFIMLFALKLCAQDAPIKIVEENIPNRLAFYAINESMNDYDVMITITGTNFRQSKAKPRLIRVPSATKVHVKTIMLMRGKTPSYKYDLIFNDSLSNRALKKPFEKVKLKPRKQITVYLPENCTTCDSLMSHLNTGKYIFRSHILKENDNIREQLQRSFGANSTSVDSLQMPIINLGGRLHTNIDTYEGLLGELNKE